MDDDPEYGAFEDFGETPTPGLSNGGLDLGRPDPSPVTHGSARAATGLAGLLPADPAAG